MACKKNDLVGKRFGRLTVISDADRKGWVVCRCDCGNRYETRAECLTRKKNNVVSCGCYRNEVVSVTGKRTIGKNSAPLHEEMRRYGTNWRSLIKQEPYKNNKSGHKGVWYDPVRGVYYAYLSFRKKKYNLGCYKNIQDAINARKEAEENIYAPFIAEITGGQA